MQQGRSREETDKSKELTGTEERGREREKQLKPRTNREGISSDGEGPGKNVRRTGAD